MPRTAIVVVSRFGADPRPRSGAVRRRLILSDVVRRSNRRRAPTVRRNPVPCAAIIVVVRRVRRVMPLCIRVLLPVLVCAAAMPTAVLPILALRCPVVPRLPRSCRAMMRVVVTLMRVVVVVKVVGFSVLPMPPPVI